VKQNKYPKKKRHPKVYEEVYEDDIKVLGRMAVAFSK
jgi:hypothetical protein